VLPDKIVYPTKKNQRTYSIASSAKHNFFQNGKHVIWIAYQIM